MKKYFTKSNITGVLIAALLVFFFWGIPAKFLVNNLWPLPSDKKVSLENHRALYLKSQDQKTFDLYLRTWDKDFKSTDTKIVNSLKNKSSTAIMPDGTVVWSEVSGGKYTIKKWKDGNVSVVKTYTIFDLNKFAHDYADKKVAFTPDIHEQTGVIWSGKFEVKDDNAVAFLDAIVSEVDNQKPVEVTKRERELNIMSGTESIRKKERERLDFEEYDHRFVKNLYLYKDDPFPWWIFGYKNNYSIGDFSEYTGMLSVKTNNFFGYVLDKDKNIISMNRQYFLNDFQGCSPTFGYSVSCPSWYKDTIYLHNNNSTSTIYSWSRYEEFGQDHMNGMKIVNISGDDNYFAVKIGNGYYVFDVNTFKSSRLTTHKAQTNDNKNYLGVSPEEFIYFR